MAKKEHQVAFITAAFISHCTNKGITALEFKRVGKFDVFTNDITQAMFEAYYEGHRSTKARLYGNFIIGKFDDNDALVFTEKPMVHGVFGKACDEVARLRNKFPDVKFALYQCVRVFKAGTKPIQQSNQYRSKEEVLAAGFSEEELEEAASYYETDVDKYFLAGYLDIDEQKGYLLRARHNLRPKECFLCAEGIEHGNCAFS